MQLPTKLSNYASETSSKVIPWPHIQLQTGSPFLSMPTSPSSSNSRNTIAERHYRLPSRRTIPSPYSLFSPLPRPPRTAATTTLPRIPRTPAPNQTATPRFVFPFLPSSRFATPVNLPHSAGFDQTRFFYLQLETNDLSCAYTPPAQLPPLSCIGGSRFRMRIAGPRQPALAVWYSPRGMGCLSCRRRTAGKGGVFLFSCFPISAWMTESKARGTNFDPSSRARECVDQ